MISNSMDTCLNVLDWTFALYNSIYIFIMYPQLKTKLTINESCLSEFFLQIVGRIIVTYFCKIRILRNSFEYFQKLVHLVGLIEMCLVTKLLLNMWRTLMLNFIFNSLIAEYFVCNILKSKKYHIRHYVRQNDSGNQKLRHFSPRYINGIHIRHYVKPSYAVNIDNTPLAIVLMNGDPNNYATMCSGQS